MRKYKREGQTEKEKGEKQIIIEVLVALVGLALIEPRVERSGEVATEAKRLKKVAMEIG